MEKSSPHPRNFSTNFIFLSQRHFKDDVRMSAIKFELEKVSGCLISKHLILHLARDQ